MTDRETPREPVSWLAGERLPQNPGCDLRLACNGRGWVAWTAPELGGIRACTACKRAHTAARAPSSPQEPSEGSPARVVATPPPGCLPGASQGQQSAIPEAGVAPRLGQPSGQEVLAGRIRAVPDPSEQSLEMLRVLVETWEMLDAKNRAYGNSALEPVRVFSRASPEEQILVRIDDKLSRLARGSAAGEDVVQDLMGYLVLLRVLRGREEA